MVAVEMCCCVRRYVDQPYDVVVMSVEVVDLQKHYVLNHDVADAA